MRGAYNDRMTGPDCGGYAQFNRFTHTLVSDQRFIDPQCEGHRMTRMKAMDCGVMYSSINTHTHAPWEDQ